jgi:hypothetical protein
MQNSSSDLSNGGSYSFASMSSRCGVAGCLHRRNKSPSDLEADDENDHDSLNQSESGSACYDRCGKTAGSGTDDPYQALRFLAAP